MRYRVRKKFMRKEIISRVNRMNINKDDYLLLYFPYGQITYKQLDNMVKYLAKFYKTNKVIALPDTTSLINVDRNFIERHIEMLQQTLINL